MIKTKVGIIVPAYNAEKTLERCLKSIISQTYKDIKIILIDDGSRDKTAYICDNYSKMDNRIMVFHKENGGVSSARNIGLKHISDCEYICFVDSDDTIESDYIEQLLKCDADVIVCASNCFKNDTGGGAKSNVHPGRYSIDEVRKSFYELNGFSGPCAKLYKTKVIETNKIKFDEGLKVGEDLIFNLNLFNYINYVEYISYVGYNVHTNWDSLTHTIIKKWSELYCVEYQKYWKERLNNELLCAGIPEHDIKKASERSASVIVYQMLRNLFVPENPYGYKDRLKNIKSILGFKEKIDEVMRCKEPVSKKTSMLVKFIVRMRSAHIAYFVMRLAARRV